MHIEGKRITVSSRAGRAIVEVNFSTEKVNARSFAERAPLAEFRQILTTTIFFYTYTPHERPSGRFFRALVEVVHIEGKRITVSSRAGRAIVEVNFSTEKVRARSFAERAPLAEFRQTRPLLKKLQQI